MLNSNPVAALAAKHEVPVSYIADCLEMTRHHVSRLKTGALPVPKVVRLACRALDLEWTVRGHGYVRQYRKRR